MRQKDWDTDRDRVRHGRVFGGEAAAYAEHRPGYAGPAVRWVLAPVRDRNPLRVLDLGAGTGKLTAALPGLARQVVAVEPDPAMRAELRRSLPDVPALAGSAERIPLRDASVDAVLAGQAAHWFDLGLALPEIARVLKPGGVVAGLWNADDDRVGWVAGLAATAPGLASIPISRWQARVGDYISLRLAETGAGRFEPAEQAEFCHSQARTGDSMVATIATHSTVLLMEPTERDQVLSSVREYLASRPETSAGPFQLPMVSVAVRAVRTGAR